MRETSYSNVKVLNSVAMRVRSLKKKIFLRPPTREIPYEHPPRSSPTMHQSPQ